MYLGPGACVFRGVAKLSIRRARCFRVRTEEGQRYRTGTYHYGGEVVVRDVEPPKTGLMGSIVRIRPGFYNETARSLHKGKHIWKRLKWAAIDKVEITMLISDLCRFIDNLYELLLYDDRKFIKAGIEALLRHAVSQAADPLELSDIEQLLGPKHSMRSKYEDTIITGTRKLALSLPGSYGTFALAQSLAAFSDVPPHRLQEHRRT